MPGDLPSSVLLSLRGRYAVITLNRPEQLNRLSRAALGELAGVLAGLCGGGRLCALVVAGAGGVFSAGADLNEVAALDPAAAYDFSRRGQEVFGALGAAAPVVIAAIDGHCLGGGLDLALACDLRYATPRATFGHPGARRGIITGWGGTQRLPRLIGRGPALRLLLTGERVDAGEALRLGLIDLVDADAAGRAVAFAARLASEYDPALLAALKASAGAG